MSGYLKRLAQATFTGSTLCWKKKRVNRLYTALLQFNQWPRTKEYEQLIFVLWSFEDGLPIISTRILWNSLSGLVLSSTRGFEDRPPRPRTRPRNRPSDGGQGQGHVCLRARDEDKAAHIVLEAVLEEHNTGLTVLLVISKSLSQINCVIRLL